MFEANQFQIFTDQAQKVLIIIDYQDSSYGFSSFHCEPQSRFRIYEGKAGVRCSFGITLEQFGNPAIAWEILIGLSALEGVH